MSLVAKQILATALLSIVYLAMVGVTWATAGNCIETIAVAGLLAWPHGFLIGSVWRLDW